MRDKLIDIILEVLWPEYIRQYILRTGHTEAHLAEAARAHMQADMIADALIAAGVVLVEPVTFSVGHPDPVGEKGEPGVVGIPAGEWVSVEDALPGDGEYLVRVEFGGRSFTSIASFAHSSQTLSEMERYGIGDKQDFWYADDCEYGVGEQLGVTHWCKFPAPPKEE